MGVILRQGAKYGVLSYLGIAIGFCNVVILYPLALTKEEIGLIDFLMQTASLLSPFVLLGVHGVSIKYYPFFQNPSGKGRDNGFLGLVLSIATLGFGIFLLLFFLFYNQIYAYYAGKSHLLSEYYNYIIPLVFSTAFGMLLTKYASNFLRIAFPHFLRDFLPKIARSIFSVLFWLGVISYARMVNGLVIVSVLSALGTGVYIYKMGYWNLRLNKKVFTLSLRREMAGYAFFSILGSLGPIVGNYIDTVMLVSFVDLESAGIYTIPMYIAMGIAIPANSVLGISAPIVSRASKEGDVGHLADLYKQTSINLTTVGLVLFLLVWSSSNDIFDFMPNGDSFRAGRIIILILGVSKIFDMVTSINNQILGYSKYYKYNFYFILLLVAANVGGNYLLIPRFGIVGVALASMFALFFFNLLKIITIKRLFGLTPFSRGHLKLLLIVVCVYPVGVFLPIGLPPLLNIALRSAIVLGLFLPAIYYWRVSDDINKILDGVWSRLR